MLNDSLVRIIKSNNMTWKSILVRTINLQPPCALQPHLLREDSKRKTHFSVTWLGNLLLGWNTTNPKQNYAMNPNLTVSGHVSCLQNSFFVESRFGNFLSGWKTTNLKQNYMLNQNLTVSGHVSCLPNSFFVFRKSAWKLLFGLKNHQSEAKSCAESDLTVSSRVSLLKRTFFRNLAWGHPIGLKDHQTESEFDSFK